MYLEPGSEFAGYRIVRRLGSGTTAAVYLAHDERLDQPVALKLMPKLATSDAVEGKRFILETRILYRFEHPCVLPIHVVDVTDGVPWMAMKYVDGGDLRVGFETAPLPLAEGVEVLWRVAAALDYAHQRGIVHRELKPADILRGCDGHVYLQLAQPDALLDIGRGFWYAPTMAPEQVVQRELSAATDVYALGAIVFRWLSGTFPFNADDDLSICLKHVVEKAPLEKLSHLPERAVLAIGRCLEKKPAARFQSAGEFIRELATGLGVDLPRMP